MPFTRLIAAGAAAIVGAMTGAVISAGPASAAVTEGAVFNNPHVASEQYKVRDHIRGLIDGAAAGSTIHVAIYNFNEQTVANNLIAAHSRGVNVKFVVNYDASLTAAVGSLKTALGTNVAAASYVSVCTQDAACIGTAGTPIMHNKFWLFSSTNGSSNVVVQSSANITPSNATKYWNNAVTLVGNTGLYNAYVKYHGDLANKRKNSNYYHTELNGNVRSYFFPRAGDSTSTDLIYNMLNENVTCEGNTTVGTSVEHRTIIRVGMFYFSRVEVAEKLRDLADKKCWIDVIYTETGASGNVPAALRNHPRIALYQVPDSTAHPYVLHSKYLLIEGTYLDQKDSKWVLTGSHNYTYPALRENDEAMLRIESNAIHDQYRANFRTIRDTALADPASPPAVDFKNGN
ncbi:phospholipase D-like domain-containing protein [Catenuloplanes indicus]|uniref:phospholipase D n=1 Tax=Catenuloplanes indicus TaxID=137267 RepID=A0AAE3W5Z5_9ACTN|nr:phospholipase D-like domain-containing protein [Catenuloplanes indicus]MDQ0370119.1 phosphatidylserine/phosphatidylglycerophosphate/cardiolipin synthase-like enzyme [Catenuloplanes indicus]